MVRPVLAERLPDWVEPCWFGTREDLMAVAPEVEIGWFDTFDFSHSLDAYRAAERARWLNTMAAGVDQFPLDLLRERGVVLTNGAGLHAITVAEYTLMGMLSIAKGYREVVRAQDRHEWLTQPPGRMELCGSTALIVGAGNIGGRIADLLRAFGSEVVEVRRKPCADAIGMDAWRSRLGEFDWVVIAVPSTGETERLMGAEEFAAMKPGSVVVNVARGAVLDQDALLEALDNGPVAGAFLDVTDPEPLPADHPLWSHPGVHITMHLSGRAQQSLFQRGAQRFLANLERWRLGQPLMSQVDLEAGY
ncbi:D-2-hydroxyacid dehydrogenase [Novosphingobium sp. PC22D]|nr:D-2-hydroxyacid dehydrogenase [Novosphingobium sp. PC22D]